MKRQTYWNCTTTENDTKQKAYVKDGKQRVKVTRTITRDCATGITEDVSSDAEDESEPDLVTEAPAPTDSDGINVSQLTVAGLRELFRSELVAWSTGQTKPAE